MLEATCRKAENIILNQQLFRLDTVTFDTFQQAIEASIQGNPAGHKLLARKTPWE